MDDHPERSEMQIPRFARDGNFINGIACAIVTRPPPQSSTPPDPTSCPPPPSPVPLTLDSAQISHPRLPSSAPSSVHEYPAVRQRRRYRSPVCPRLPLPLPALILPPHRPALSSYGGKAFQKPAATAAIVPTSPLRSRKSPAAAAAAESSSPVTHTPTAPDATASESPSSLVHPLPTAADSADACPETRWRTHRTTAASRPRSSAAVPDASACPTTNPPPEPAPQSHRKKSRAARTADSRRSDRPRNLRPPPIHKARPPADSFQPLSAYVRQTH